MSTTLDRVLSADDNEEEAAYKRLTDTDSKDSTINKWKAELKMAEEFDTQSPSVFAVKWSHDSELLATAGGDGQIRIFNNSGRFAYKFCPNKTGFPTTTIAWRPRSESLGSLQVLVSGNTNGEIIHWHCPSEREIHRIVEKENEIYTLSYRPDGMQFVTAGKDCTIRIYDEATKALVGELAKGLAYSDMVGHGNRIFATTYSKGNPNLVVSGGWDNALILWDVRARRQSMTIYGPHIAGNSIDIQNDHILTGSWRGQEALQEWDIKTGKKIKKYTHNTPFIYTAKYHPTHQGVFAAGGTGGKNCFRLFHESGEISKPVTLSECKGIFTSDFNHNGSRIAVGGLTGNVRIFDVL